ncbi:AAA family ATPase [Aurantimonas endophytica]|uniref:DNA polymerase III delta prime subunit n=1 Tax=Aurantimonas endophytica TaxID=1522175 RepID=A0A7W6MR20_9HYPH|nr:AAA family ATPase [Aurantimonas endophytica]MBB4004592.1 DNA polymerase III delta prime subunit [Aurantimonas endophytica]MCO6405428.1 AAA family ATPase [Aurantimonas endophytica]
MALPKRPRTKLRLDIQPADTARATNATSGEHKVAESVATLLLIEHALRQNEMDVGHLVDRFDRPGSLVLLRARVEGFATAALRLLEAGSILPGRTQTLDVDYVKPGGYARFADDEDIRWRIVTMVAGEHDGEPDIESDAALRMRITHVARTPYPLLVIAEAPPIPSLLALAADVVLDGGSLDAHIIAETAARVVGHEHGAALRTALAAAPLDPRRLSVADLSVAIRPGVPVDRMIAMLSHLASRPDDDDQDDGDGASSSAPGSSSPWAAYRTRSSQSDSDWDKRVESLPADAKGRHHRKSGSGSRRPGQSGKKDTASTSGSEVILPEASSDPFRLSVETLAGFGEARGWGLDLKADLALWRAGTLPWDQLSSRLLLSGPPGTGKTTYAKALCNSLDLPLHVSSVSTWLEASYLGNVISRMNAAFAEASQNAPSILFIDECDGIGKRQPQDRDYADYWNALVNKLLELLDGAAKAEGVIIVGATNRPEAMDEALKRSGRWENQITIPMPDREALKGILAHHVGPELAGLVAAAHPDAPMPHHREPVDVVLTQLARQADGRSGADIERLVREARGKARREGRGLTHADLTARLASGRPARPHDLRYRMAVHEAGHAVVRRALNVGSELSLSIEAAEGGYAESMLDLNVVQSEAWVMAIIAAYLAGRAAETMVFGNVTVGSGGERSSDLASATRLALSLEIELGFGERPLLHRPMQHAELLLLRDDPLSHAVHARLETALALATRTLEANRAMLLRLADALCAAGSMDTAEVEAVFAAGGTEASTAVEADAATEPKAKGAEAGMSKADRPTASAGSTMPNRAAADRTLANEPSQPKPPEPPS